MNIEDILSKWDGDSNVEDTHLGEAATNTAKLHARYLRLLINAKMTRAKMHSDYNEVRRSKFRYYRGEMTRAELLALGWEQWQHNKPLKTEMEEILRGDEDLGKLQLRIDYMDNVVYALESIMHQIKQRDYQLSNAIKWKLFMAGA